MTGRGTNGLHPVHNLSERQKCPEHPTKRKWFDGDAARAEADRRSLTARIPIEAYLCPACGTYHLTKSTGGDTATLPGGKFSVGEFKALSPNHPVFSGEPPVDDPVEEPPIAPGDFDTRVRFARRYLEQNPEPTSQEMCEHLGGCTKESLRKVMTALGYRNTRGRTARWVPDIHDEAAPMTAAELLRQKRADEGRELHEVDESELTPAEESIAGPATTATSSAGPRWIDLNADRVRHLAVGDLIDAYAAAGIELRIQVDANA